jgi:hypothetical protein
MVTGASFAPYGFRQDCSVGDVGKVAACGRRYGGVPKNCMSLG